MQTPPPLLGLTVGVFCLVSNVYLCLALADGCIEVAHLGASGPFQNCPQKTLVVPESHPHVSTGFNLVPYKASNDSNHFAPSLHPSTHKPGSSLLVSSKTADEGKYTNFNF